MANAHTKSPDGWSKKRHNVAKGPRASSTTTVNEEAVCNGVIIIIPK